MTLPMLLAELRSVLADIASGKGDPLRAADQGMELIDRAIELAGRGTVARSVRGGGEVEYVVEVSANGSTLSERRKTGKTQPFRCPKAIYDALAKVLGNAEKAIPLDELGSAVAEITGEQPPEFQLRVPIRLWMNTAPPLVARNRARYRSCAPKDFVISASALWADLKQG